MKSSKYFTSLAITSLIKKKTRTLLTVIATSITVAIFFSSINLGYNIKNVFSNYENGIYRLSYHYVLNSKVDEDNPRYLIHKEQNTGYYIQHNDEIYNIRYRKDESVPPYEFKDRIYDECPQGTIPISVTSDMNLQLGDTFKATLYEGLYDDTNIFGITNNIIETDKTVTYYVCEIIELDSFYQYYLDYNHIIYVDDQSLESANNPYTYFIYDQHIEARDSKKAIEDFYESTNILEQNKNINSDKLRHYIVNMPTLSGMLLLISITSLIIGMVSIRNVIIISDTNRRKEFGVLKSVGATDLDLRRFIFVEFSIIAIIGTIIGIVLGIGLNYFIISGLVKKASMTLSSSMICRVEIILISMLIGYMMMVGIGMLTYRRILTSPPINDLKDLGYIYESPKKYKSYEAKNFSWKMFLMYNGRHKKQTRNLYVAFVLLITTTILFSAVGLSNFFYRLELSEKDDIVISQGVQEIEYDKIVDSLYDAYDSGELCANNIFISRRTGYYDHYLKEETVNEKEWQSKYRTKLYQDKEGYVRFNKYAIVFNDHQFDEIKEYVVLGDIDDCKDEGILYLLKSGKKNKADCFNLDKLINSEIIIDGKTQYIKAIALIDEDSTSDIIDLSRLDGEVIMRTSNNLLIDDNSPYYSINDIQYNSVEATIDLKDNADPYEISNLIFKLFNLTQFQFNHFENNVISRNNGEVGSFFMEICFIPMFLLIMIIVLINLYNVLQGNMLLKKRDNAILESVGMTDQQFYGILLYEYAEAYINASFLSFLLILPLYLIKTLLFDEYLITSAIVAIMLVDLIIACIFILLTIFKNRNSSSIDIIKTID